MSGPKTHGFVLCVIAFAMMVGCIESEYGDNDTRSGAFEIEMDTRYESKLRRKSDREWFKFTTTHGSETFDLIEVEVEALDSRLVPRLDIYDTDGRGVGAANASEVGGSVSYAFATRGDTFFVVFSGWDLSKDEEHGSSGAYAFTVRNLDANDAYAGNHSRDDAYEMELGAEHPGSLVSPLEADYFFFTTDHDEDTWDVVEVSLLVEQETLLARLVITDVAGNPVHISVSEGMGADLSHAFVTTGGTFHVRVSGWDPERNRDHGSTGDYTLVARNMFENDEFAPNHSITDAAEVELDVWYEGAIVAEEEADYYRFTTAHTAYEYDTVVFEVQAHDPGLMVYIELYDQHGNLSNLTTKASRPGENAELGWVSPGGTRHIRVSGWDPAENRDHGSTGAYRFRVRNLDQNDPFMGNHRFEHAYPIELNQTYDAVLLCIYETDWFIVQDVTPGESYQVIAQARSAGLALNVQIHDSRGELIHAARAGSYGGSVVATFTAVDEAFVIRFSGYHIEYNVDNGSRGAYQFRVGLGD